MTQMIVLPHVELCPDGAVIEAEVGKSICENLLQNDIPLDHACEMSCACTTCHVIVREGFNSLEAAEEIEEDLLDKAWGLEPNSRLGCQAIVGSTPLVVEIPKYSINMAKEGHRK
ncbi:MAG: ISC system 2Fe-2S type ferredoxin [Azonexus sp.]|nr:ISC system 2Fe-2S type ferredoxin [Azonexus sp.]MCK6412420.1 ISC system 2Fe-2S type ferredoxin [Azonexus sp.]